jgi:dienelactone hydrolase
MKIMRFSTVGLLTGVLLTCGALASYAQDVADVAEAEVTTQSGSRGVMVRPLGPGPFPAVLHMHGSGDIVADNVQILRLFARAGYVAMDIEYRRTAGGSIDIGDIQTSLRYLNGSRYVRSDVIGLNGFSLGARMALLLAAREKVVALSAIAARTTSMSNPTVLDQAAKLTCPILLQHGTEDSVVPYQDSVLLEKKLRGLGRPVELISYPGADHGTLPWNQVYGRVLAFFRTHLR